MTNKTLIDVPMLIAKGIVIFPEIFVVHAMVEVLQFVASLAA
ncbi:MAG: hypothetical protein ACJAYV_002001 [Oleispira sp.]|jgi:hypothetical protein